MNGFVGFAGSLAELAVGLLMTTAFLWFALSYWWDGRRLILGSVSIAAVLYILGAVTAPEAQLGTPALTVLATLLVAAIVMKLWLRSEASKYGSYDG